MVNSKNKIDKKKREDYIYRYFMSTILLGLFYYFFIQSDYLGNDNRYDLFVFWIPVLIGLILIVKFNVLSIKWKDITSTIKNESNILKRIIHLPYIFLAHFISSVIFFWIPSNIVWDCLNKYESKRNNIEVYELPIAAFQDVKSVRSKDRIYFNFKGKKEFILVNYKTIKSFLDKDPNKYNIIIEVRKGLWDYYILKSWDIKQKQ